MLTLKLFSKVLLFFFFVNFLPNSTLRFQTSSNKCSVWTTGVLTSKSSEQQQEVIGEKWLF